MKYQNRVRVHVSDWCCLTVGFLGGQAGFTDTIMQLPSVHETFPLREAGGALMCGALAITLYIFTFPSAVYEHVAPILLETWLCNFAEAAVIIKVFAVL